MRARDRHTHAKIWSEASAKLRKHAEEVKSESGLRLVELALGMSIVAAEYEGLANKLDEEFAATRGDGINGRPRA